MTSFNNILSLVVEALERLNAFMYSTVPIIFSLILSTGKFATATVFQPIILFLITITNVLINKLIIPVILIYTVLNIVSNISEKNQLSKLAGFIKSTTIWILGLSLTILVGVMSLEGGLTSSVDAVTGKTAKAAVTNFIPVVGKILGDAVDTVLGCTVILKNSIGFIGVMIIILICIMPIIKITILMALYYLTSAVAQPIADSRIIKCIGHVGDSLKLILAIMVASMFMYIISITIIIKITNVGI